MISDKKILESLKSFAQAVEGMFEGHAKAFELIATEHDKLLGVCKDQQSQITLLFSISKVQAEDLDDLEKAVSILRLELNELKFKENNT